LPKSLNSEISSVIKGKGDIDKFLFGVYTQTYKPQELYYGIQYADGRIEQQLEEKESVANNNFIKEVILLREPEYYDIQKLNRPTLSIGSGRATRNNPNYYSELLKYEIEVAKLLDQAQNNNEWIKVENTILFKEKYLDKDVDYFINHYAFKNSTYQWVQDVDNLYDDNYTFENTYNKDKWTVVDPIVGGVIDIASTGLSFVGLDAIAEGVGLIYFTSRGDAVNTGLYAAAIVVPVLSSGELRLAKAAINSGIMFYKGAKYSIKAGETSVRLIATNSYKYGKVLNFFDLLDSSITPTQVDNFINSLDIGDVDPSQIKKILSEVDETKRVKKFLNIADGKANLEGLVKSIKNLSNVNANQLTKLLSNIDNLSDAAKGALLNKIKTLEGNAGKFIDDFADKAGDLAVLVNKPELLDSWEVLVSNPILRKKLDNLNNLTDALNKYPNDKEKILNALTNSDSKTKLLKELNEISSPTTVDNFLKNLNTAPKPNYHGQGVSIKPSTSDEMTSLISKREKAKIDADEIKIDEGIDSDAYKIAKNKIGLVSELYES